MTEKTVPFWRLSMDLSHCAAALLESLNAADKHVPEVQKEAIRNGVAAANVASGVLYQNHLRDSINRGEVW